MGNSNKNKMLKILQYGSPILEKPTNKVENVKDPKILKLIDEMLKVLEKEEDHSAGLSAPQVGQSLKIAICRRLDLEDELQDKNKQQNIVKKTEAIWEVMINPQITYKSNDKSTKWEGCLSVNQGELFGEVTRPRIVKVKYTTIEGKEVEIIADGYFSHVVQHELDHLDGVLFLKYINDPTKLYTPDEIEDL